MSTLELITTPEPAKTFSVATQVTPADLVRYAMDSGADLERLEKLMAMQVAWEERQAQKAYNEAFAAFKSEAVRIIKNKDVTAGPLAGKRYAELYAVVNAITPALSKHGLSAAWRITKDEKDWIEVTCTLKHAGGFSESVSMGGPPDAGGAKNAIQARASTVSYLERYTLKAITGLSEQDQDDDGAGSAVDDSEAATLQALQDASMEGSQALRAAYDRLKPSDALWKREARSLKLAAGKADQDSKATQ